MRDAARIILYRFASLIERYLRGDGNPVVFSLSTPNLYKVFEESTVTSSVTSQGQPSDPGKGKGRAQDEESQPGMYLGSRRLLQQTLYAFCAKYLGKNIYWDDKKFRNPVVKPDRKFYRSLASDDLF